MHQKWQTYWYCRNWYCVCITTQCSIISEINKISEQINTNSTKSIVELNSLRPMLSPDCDFSLFKVNLSNLERMSIPSIESRISCPCIHKPDSRTFRNLL